MVFEELTGEPARRSWLRRGHELFTQPVPGVEAFGGLGRDGLRLGHVRPRKIRGTGLVQPLQQAKGGATVFQVVGGDLIEQRLALLMKPALVGEDGLRS